MGKFGIGVAAASVAAFGLGYWGSSQGGEARPPVDETPRPPVSALPREARPIPGVDEIATITSPAGRKAAAEELVRELAKREPRSAIAAIDSLPLPAGTRERLLGEVFAIWAATEPEAAAKAALAERDPARREIALEAVAKGWAGAAPAAALAWAAGLEGDSDLRAQVIEAAVLGGIGSNPDAAASAIASLPADVLVRLAKKSGAFGESTLAKVALMLGKDDPGVSLRWLESLPPEALATMLYQNIRNAWSVLSPLFERDPEAALRFAATLPPHSSAHHGALRDALFHLAKTDLKRAWKLSGELPLYQRKFAISHSAHAWSKEAPLEAFAYFLEHPEMGISAGAPLRHLAARDAEGAAQALALIDQAPANEHAKLYEELLPALAKHDAPGAMARALESDSTPGTKRSIAYEWIRADQPGFEAWLATQPDSFQPIGFEALAGSLIHTNPSDLDAASAASFLTRAARYDIDSQQLLQFGATADVAAQRLVASDLDAAVAWLASLGASPFAERPAGTIVRKALAVDAAAASEWIAELPPGISHDVAASALAQHLIDSDPQSAFRWAQTIEDERQAGSLVGSAALRLFRNDPQATIAQVEAMPTGRAHDQAATTLARQLYNDDPEQSFALARTIADDKRREIGLRMALEQLNADRERQRALIESLPESQPDREEFLKRWENRDF